MANKYEDLVSNITQLVGGKENVMNFAHCITRLRFDVKDKGLVDTKAIESKAGVTGTRWMNHQLQIIIGPEVATVYDEICKHDGYEKNAAVAENLDAPKGKKSLGWVMEQLSGCVFPIVTVLFANSFVTLLVTVLGMCGVSAETGTIKLLNSVASCGLYFIPVFVGYTAAKKFGGNVMLGMLIGAMMISPTYLGMVTDGTALDFVGIPVAMVNYSSNFLPTLLAVAVMVPIEKFFKKVLPGVIEGVFTPFLTLLIMIPLTFCVVGPVASTVGSWLANGMIWLYDNFGFLAGGIFVAVVPFFIMFGFHIPLVLNALALFAAQGYDTTVFVAGILCSLVQCGITLAVMLKTKNESLKSTAGGALVCAFAGGTTEPALFGVTLRSKFTLAAMVIAGFAGGCVAGLGHVAAYTITHSSIWSLVAFVPGGIPNLIWMIVACIVSFGTAFAITFFAFNEKEFANG